MVEHSDGAYAVLRFPLACDKSPVKYRHFATVYSSRSIRSTAAFSASCPRKCAHGDLHALPRASKRSSSRRAARARRSPLRSTTASPTSGTGSITSSFSSRSSSRRSSPARTERGSRSPSFVRRFATCSGSSPPSRSRTRSRSASRHSTWCAFRRGWSNRGSPPRSSSPR